MQQGIIHSSFDSISNFGMHYACISVRNDVFFSQASRNLHILFMRLFLFKQKYGSQFSLALYCIWFSTKFSLDNMLSPFSGKFCLLFLKKAASYMFWFLRSRSLRLSRSMVVNLLLLLLKLSQHYFHSLGMSQAIQFDSLKRLQESVKKARNLFQ